MEAKGELASGTTQDWLSKTPSPEALPERTKPKQPTRARTSNPPKSKDWSLYG